MFVSVARVTFNGGIENIVNLNLKFKFDLFVIVK